MTENGINYGVLFPDHGSWFKHYLAWALLEFLRLLGRGGGEEGRVCPATPLTPRVLKPMC